MNKIIILRDCTKCPYSGQGTSHIGCRKTNKAIAINYIPDWCPLHSLPEKEDVRFASEVIRKAYELGKDSRFYNGWLHGWNACLDEITGGRKDE